MIHPILFPLAIFLWLAGPVGPVGAEEGEPDPPISPLVEYCDAGDFTACFQAGEQYRRERGDLFSAEKYFLKACDGWYMPGCTYAGSVLLETAEMKSPQWLEAETLLQRGCDGTDGRACFQIGKMRIRLDQKKEARNYFKRSCDYGNALGCKLYYKLNFPSHFDPEISAFCEKRWRPDYVMVKFCEDSHTRAKMERVGPAENLETVMEMVRSGYELGMTLDQTDAARDDDVQARCGFYYADHETCFSRKITLFGETAEIFALVNDETNLLDKINLDFTEYEEDSDCARLVKKMLFSASKALGKWEKKFFNYSWTLPARKRLDVVDLCDVGFASMSYSKETFR